MSSGKVTNIDEELSPQRVAEAQPNPLWQELQKYLEEICVRLIHNGDPMQKWDKAEMCVNEDFHSLRTSR